MDIESRKRVVLGQSREVFGDFLTRSVVAIFEHDRKSLKSYGSGTCVYYRGHYLVMTAGHVIEGISNDRLSLVYKCGPSDDIVPIDAVFFRIDRTIGLDVGFLVLRSDVARVLNKQFLTDNYFDVAPANLATDLVALNGFPGGYFYVEGKKHHKFGSLTYITICEETNKWHKLVNPEMQIEFGYPNTVDDAVTNQPFDLPDVEGMSGGGMWLLNINPKKIWSPESCRLVGIIAKWNESKQYICGNRVVHWLRFADEVLGSS
jgi:hypothetical protein